jgi:hypothetical protein
MFRALRPTGFSIARSAPRQESVAQFAGFENIFDATVESVAEDRGNMMCKVKGKRAGVFVLLETRVGIRAGDILRVLLKDSPIHTGSGWSVSRGEKADATANSGGADGFREVRMEDEAGAVSRRDGTDRAVGGATGAG